MEGVPDENDLVYETYGIDLIGLFRYLYETILGLNWGDLVEFLSFLWNLYSIFAIIIALIFFAGFIYAKLRFGEVYGQIQSQLTEAERQWAERYGEARENNGRWSEIQKHLNDPNPNSWKVAIIEADIYLEEILSDAGYNGATLGEKLKSANPASFTTIQDAWEAHKVRNEIAHAGGDFVLTRRVAEETIRRYERVFSEFGVL